jgi:selenocysteine-specific translation elongation factor
VLVVDAQEGVGITTDEAVGCAEDLGVQHVIVALNKADLVDASRLKQVEVREQSCVHSNKTSLISFETAFSFMKL